MGGSLKEYLFLRQGYPRERPSLLDSLHRFLGKGRQNQTVVPSSTPSTHRIPGFLEGSGVRPGGGQWAGSPFPPAGWEHCG